MTNFQANPVYPQPSPQLISQTINQRAIADLLVWQNRTQWEDNYNCYDLTIEAWAIGIWVKEAGLISYQTFAEWLRYIAQLKAWQLKIIPKGNRLLLVQGKRQTWYTVVHQQGQWRCECALYRCFHNRIEAEMPLLYQSLERQIFCHHTEAARQRSLDY